MIKSVAAFVLLGWMTGCTAPEATASEPAARAPEAVEPTADADPQARALAESVLERMGGAEAWRRTRYLTWTFFGRRRHMWDRHAGRARIEADGDVYVIDLETKEGRAWSGGEEVLEPEALAEAMQRAHGMWVNDSYWMFMPYKLLDPGVVLRFAGAGELQDGRPCQLLEMTFDGVGNTPDNRYTVAVADDTGLVEEWSFFAEADQLEPGFTLPWSGWKPFGAILLATDHGRGMDWAIEVPQTLPEELFR